MKKTIISLLVAAAAVSVLPGCIQETFPLEGVATSDQMAQSSAAMKGSVDGMVAQTYQPYYFYGSSNQLEYDISYAGLLITYARMTNDLVNNSATIGYDWWCGYAGVSGYVMNADNSRQRVPYMTLYKIIKSANDIIGPLAAAENLNAEQKIYLGTAYAYRALMYHDLYNMYLPATNKYTDVSAVEGLTTPIVLSSAEPESEYKTARAPKEAMSAQVLSDLDKAEELLDGYKPTTARYPGIAVVYGLKARMYMAMLDYANAAKYARMAIDASGKTPLTEEQWHNPKQAFCDANGNNSWMWYYSISGNNMGNLCNPTGFLAGEADWGYNSLTHLAIHKWLYDRLNRTDFRKRSFIDPDRETYPASYYEWGDQAGFLKDYPFLKLPDYFSLKIRCKEGNWQTYSVGGAVDWPIMRVEEMYLIEAEATGMQAGKEAEGIALLTAFAKTRDASYTYGTHNELYNNSATPAFQNECWWQRRVELWGEGFATKDIKRLNKGIIRSYAGTNHIDSFQWNSDTPPQWMTLCFVGTEANYNSALVQNTVPEPHDGNDAAFVW